MKKQLLAAALLVTGCAMVQPVSRGATLILKAKVAAPRVTQTDVPAYTKDLIDHAVLQIYLLADGVEQGKIAERSISREDLDSAIVFSNLKNHTSYRVKAFAYASSDESTLISNTDAGSCFDIAITTDDAPVVSGLTLTLVDRPFNSVLPLTGVVVTNGGLVPDRGEQLERYLTPIAKMTTVAGGTYGYTDGIGTAARFSYPYGVTLDEAGNLYVVDSSNYTIRKITPAGQVSVLAGYPRYSGYSEGTGTAARLNYPQAIVYHSGMLYIADADGNSIRKVSLDGVVQYWVGSSGYGSVDGTGLNASFKDIYGMTFDATGDLYVTECGGYHVRKITPEGVVTTVAGGTTYGFRDDQGTNALFNNPYGITVDATGNLYVADTGNYCIRKITPDGIVSTFAGATTSGYRDGTSPLFSSPRALAFDSSGNLYISDSARIRVRKPNGEVCTVAGNGNSTAYDAYGLNAGFSTLYSFVFDPAGVLYFAEPSNYRIRKLEWVNGVGP